MRHNMGFGDRLPLQLRLELQTVNTLNDISSALGIRSPARKADKIKVIMGAMSGDNLIITWNRLNELQKQAVAEAIYSSNECFNFEQFRAKYKESFDRETFTENSKIFYLFINSGSVPTDLADKLRKFVPKPKPFVLKTIESLPDDPELIVSNSSLPAIYNLKGLLHLIDAGKLKVSSTTGKATSSSIKAISKVLYDGDLYSSTDAEEEIGPIRSFA